MEESEQRAVTVRLWPKVVEAYKGYDKYQQKTSRNIPLVIVE